MQILRWAITIVLGLFWFSCLLRNLVDLINARIQRTSTTLILFFGGMAGVLAVLACPWPETARWAWVPALLDPGCIPAGLLILYAAVFGKFKD